jgi:hypothetical protein
MLALTSANPVLSVVVKAAAENFDDLVALWETARGEDEG